MTTRRPVPFSPDRASLMLSEDARSAASDRDAAFGANGARVQATLPLGQATEVKHGLKRQPQGVQVMRCVGGPPLIETQAWDRSTVKLYNHHTGNIEVTLWVW